MTRILVESPNKGPTLEAHSVKMFGAAKSTLGEDIDILRAEFRAVPFGPAGHGDQRGEASVRYRPSLAAEERLRTVKDLAQMLAAPERARSAGRFSSSMADILAMPDVVERMGTIIYSQLYRAEPDFVLTMETKEHSDLR